MSLTPSQWSNVDYIEPRNPSNIPSAIRLRAICQSTQASFVSSSSSSSLHSPPTFPNPPAVTLVPASSTQGSYLSQQTAIGKDVVQPIRARTRSTASSVASTSVPIQQPPLLGASPTVPANTRPRTNRHGKGRAVVSQGRDAAVRKTKAKALKGKVSGVDADELATRTSNRQILAERVRAQLRARMTLPSGSAELWVLSRGLGILVHYAFRNSMSDPALCWHAVEKHISWHLDLMLDGVYADPRERRAGPATENAEASGLSLSDGHQWVDDESLVLETVFGSPPPPERPAEPVSSPSITDWRAQVERESASVRASEERPDGDGPSRLGPSQPDADEQATTVKDVPSASAPEDTSPSAAALASSKADVAPPSGLAPSLPIQGLPCTGPTGAPPRVPTRQPPSPSARVAPIKVTPALVLPSPPPSRPTGVLVFAPNGTAISTHPVPSRSTAIKPAQARPKPALPTPPPTSVPSARPPTLKPIKRVWHLEPIFDHPPVPIRRPAGHRTPAREVPWEPSMTGPSRKRPRWV